MAGVSPDSSRRVQTPKASTQKSLQSSRSGKIRVLASWFLRLFKQQQLLDKRPTRGNVVLGALIGLLLLVIIIFGVSGYYRIFIAPPIDNAMIEHTDALVRKGDQIQLSILNASGKQGLARKAMDYFRSHGFDVVEIDNWKAQDTVFASFVIDRIGDTLSAKKVARSAGIPDSLIVRDIDSALFLRCSVVLGNDFEKLKMFKK